uniref:Uncharacterized protein n=1 Tax=Arundo donax TaxID=35708 RepID=A0A0A8ZXW4_ARUDO
MLVSNLRWEKEQLKKRSCDLIETYLPQPYADKILCYLINILIIT